MKAASYTLRSAKINLPKLEFFESSRRKEDGMEKSAIEEYIGYKKGFLKHLQFDPDAENLSNISFTKTNAFKKMSSS